MLWMVVTYDLILPGLISKAGRRLCRNMRSGQRTCRRWFWIFRSSWFRVARFFVWIVLVFWWKNVGNQRHDSSVWSYEYGSLGIFVASVDLRSSMMVYTSHRGIDDGNAIYEAFTSLATMRTLKKEAASVWFQGWLAAVFCCWLVWSNLFARIHAHEQGQDLSREEIVSLLFQFFQPQASPASSYGALMPAASGHGAAGLMPNLAVYMKLMKPLWIWPAWVMKVFKNLLLGVHVSVQRSTGKHKQHGKSLLKWKPPELFILSAWAVFMSGVKVRKWQPQQLI